MLLSKLACHAMIILLQCWGYKCGLPHLVEYLLSSKISHPILCEKIELHTSYTEISSPTHLELRMHPVNSDHLVTLVILPLPINLESLKDKAHGIYLMCEAGIQTFRLKGGHRA